jgi:hypothetical protein
LPAEEILMAEHYYGPPQDRRGRSPDPPPVTQPDPVSWYADDEARWINAPRGGWVLLARNQLLYVPDPEAWAGALTEALTAASGPRYEPRLDELITLAQRILEMSQTQQQQADAANAATTAALDAIQTDITAITAELHAAIPPVGSVVTQATFDTMTANAARLTGVKTALDTLAAPAAPAPATVTFDPTDPTLNGAVMADGVTLRNTPGADPANPMAGFDVTKPVTS